ncbi:SOS response-associated peptidase family protein [Brevundimonas faecalis]|uniref:SOS response-associated peptidase family protein n=1 Tax=Brevundimonas faecalis TaxID=947378 RepID=UPI0036093098
MCNNYRLHVPANQIAAPFAEAGRKLTTPEGLPNLEPTDYRIGDRAPILTLDAGQPKLTMTPWAWQSNGRPVFNFRSEGRSFANSARCLIPADGFYEFTEPKVAGRKTKWLFTMVNHPWFWIAGIVKDGAFAMLTTEPGPDIAHYHDRQIVLLPPGAGVHWLDLSAHEDLILAPSPLGSLDVERVYPVIA